LGTSTPSFGYTNEYKIYSSVTGKEITTLSDTGEKTKTSVYMNGSVIAEMGFDPGVYHTVQFKHTDPVSGVEAETNVSGTGSNSEGNRTFEAFGAEIPSYSEASAEVPSYQHGGSVLNPEHGCEVNGGPVRCDRLGIWLSGLGIPVVGGVIIQETTISKANYLKLNNEDELANIFANRGGIFEKHGNEMWFVMSYSEEAGISAVELGSRAKGTDKSQASRLLTKAQTSISQDCINALKKLGVWDRVQNLLKTEKLYDVDTIQNEPASHYFANLAAKGLDVGTYFDSLHRDAYTVRGKGNKTGIYYRSSNVNLPSEPDLRLHETTHLAYPTVLPAGQTTYLDEILAKALNLEQQAGLFGRNKESWSDAVSRYFNNKCDPREEQGGWQRAIIDAGGVK
jgi:hypothetical protein